jgi:SAM-dependent methyltransferase
VILVTFLKRILPNSICQWLVQQQRRFRLQRVRMGTVDFGQLRHTTPVSKVFGLDRGLPIDRYYIENFLTSHSADIKGRVLELGDSFYTDKFGQDKVTKKDVLHVVEGNQEATIVADLTDANHIPSGAFDCIIFTQSLQMIYDFRSALTTLHRILKPGGVLLCTTAGISKIARRLGKDDWGEYWHFTSQSLEIIFKEAFPESELEVQSKGNVLSATSFLHGLATEELIREELDFEDPDYEVIICIRAVKA